MATLVSSNEHHGTAVSDTGKGLKTCQIFGLASPENTPDPETGRNEADRARREARVAQSIEGVQPQSRPSFDHNSDSNTDYSSDSDDELSDPTPEQVKIVQEVLKCRGKEYDKILGVEEGCGDLNVILRACQERVVLTHPVINRTPGSADANKKVLHAGKRKGVDKEIIREMKNWNGKDEIGGLRLSDEGIWEPDNDHMDTETPAKPNTFHLEQYAEATPFLSRLVINPKDAGAIEKLQEINSRIKENNKSNGLPEDQWQNFAIIFTTYIANFQMAAPWLARLQKSHADIEARTEFEKINDGLRRFNDKYHYPSAWVMDLPAEEVQNKAAEVKSPRTSVDIVQTTAGRPKFRRNARKPGYVIENGVSKRIEGCLKVGNGYQLLIEEEGENGLAKCELVAASTFGKGFGESHMKQPGAKILVLGSVEELKGKSFDDLHVGKVASVRRDPRNEPVGGWTREVKTIAFVGFGENPEGKWYARSMLGSEFGQAAVDEELNGYRNDAGQELPVPPTRRATRNGKSRVSGGDNDN